MNITINAVKFKPADKLEEFINEKVSKLEKHYAEINSAEVTLKVDKPEASNNKIADIRLIIKGNDMFASKQSDTFEESIQDCIVALKAQIDKHKEKR